MKRFNNKVVVVTGGGSGIGKATGLRFAEEGAKVALVDASIKTKEDTLELFVKQDSEAIFMQGDVSDVTTVQNIINTVISNFGKLDILVNCAGIVLPGTLETTEEADFDRTMAVNVKGIFLMTKYAVEQMLKNGGGAVINIASSIAIRGVTNRLAYTASKGAVLSMTRALASEYLRKNVRFNSICPGTTYTPSLQQRINASADPKKALEGLTPPIGRLGKESEIAEAILFAADDKVSFMTGAALSIDGGETI
jgi:meso-butanediol dehydrogenase / (S,S)-butanediol dehydrogenase / diacetyl reductase